jgi:hypothetical protein
MDEEMAGPSVALIVAALALHLLKHVLRARAWHNIAGAAYPADRIRWRHALGAYLSGTGANAVLPGRPGELLKLGLIKRKAPHARYAGLASTLLSESVFDIAIGTTVLVFAIVAGGASFAGMPAWGGEILAHPGLAGGLVALLAVVTFLGRRPLRRRLGSITSEAAHGLAVIGRPGVYLRTVVSWQLLALAVRLGSIACFLAAFHAPGGFRAIPLVLAVQSAANAMPLTPNGAGTQQALLMATLGGGAAAASMIGFSAGAQLATTVTDVAVAACSLLLMTGSFAWRGLITAKETAAATL